MCLNVNFKVFNINILKIKIKKNENKISIKKGILIVKFKTCIFNFINCCKVS